MSSAAGQKLLASALKERNFAPAYLFHGDEEFRKNEALTQLIRAAVDPATRDFNLEIRRGTDIDAGTLGSLLNTPPMMADRRMVVVRDAGALKKDARLALDRYLGAPAPDTVLVLVFSAPKGDRPGKSDKLEDALFARTVAVQFESLDGEKLTKWIRQQAEQLGRPISAGAIDLLQGSVGNDLGQLAIELEKLASYVREGEIDEAAVGAIVGVRRGETLGDLLRCVAQRDLRGALDIVPIVVGQGRSTGVQVGMALTTQMLGLSFARARRDRGVPPAGIRGEIFNVFLKAGGGFTGMSWSEAGDLWTKCVDKWTAAELDDALRVLLATDRGLKESRVSSDSQIIVSLILALCSPARGRGAA